MLVGHYDHAVRTWQHLIDAEPVLVSLDYIVRHQARGVSRYDWCREQYFRESIRPVLMTLVGKYRPKARPNTDEAQTLLMDDYSLTVATDYLLHQLPKCLSTCECQTANPFDTNKEMTRKGIEVPPKEMQPSKKDGDLAEWMDTVSASPDDPDSL